MTFTLGFLLGLITTPVLFIAFLAYCDWRDCKKYGYPYLPR